MNLPSEQIYDVLVANLSDPVYAGAASIKQDPAYVVYSQVSTTPINAIDGRTGTRQHIFRFDCISETYDGVMLLAERVRAAITGGGLAETHVSEAYQYDADSRLHRIMIDYDIVFRGPLL